MPVGHKGWREVSCQSSIDRWILKKMISCDGQKVVYRERNNYL